MVMPFLSAVRTIVSNLNNNSIKERDYAFLAPNPYERTFRKGNTILYIILVL